ncbi:MAG: nitroreductase [Bdellovibrionales bacterium]
MNLVELIQSRRTIQTYNSKPVAENLVDQALQLAMWAPNHKLTFPWRFIKAGPEARRQLAQLAARLKAAKSGQPPSAAQIAMLEKTYLTPSHLLILLMDQTLDAFQAREDYASVAMGVQNMGLFLWSHQVGTKWSSGGVTSHEKTYQILQVDHNTQEIVGFLWVGYFDQSPRATERPACDGRVRSVP